jgi:hypothetical protein
MTTLERELYRLKPHDPPQVSEPYDGCPGTVFIATAGHGYLAVPIGHPRERLAQQLCSYGFFGKLAIYLEEDYEAVQFIKAINNDHD